MSGPTRNVCVAHACAGYTGYGASCNAAGVCEVVEQVKYFLAVSVPQTSSFAPGLTYGFPDGTLEASTLKRASCLGCLRLPNPQEIYGTLTTTSAVAALLGKPLGDAEEVALPTRASLRPLLTLGDRTFDARLLGLPLDLNFSVPVADERARIRGPFGAPQPGFRLLVTPMNYELDVQPVESLAGQFPPVTLPYPVDEESQRQTGLQTFAGKVAEAQLDATADRVAVIESNSRDLRGWDLFLRASNSRSPASAP
jgi:hypothetical protein